jgi:nitroimidazol reductase NimA-like FMN-containing flavoprotein (pyridoxamine 5'-phosphate oxidase superfamily)/osmotically-inducible protein OsmY
MLNNTPDLNPPHTAVDAPLFSVLDRKACEAILSRNSVGRIAFSLHDSVRIVPIHYAYASGWIYGRTATAGKLDEIIRNRRVAFEVDEHTQLFEWRSVVATGPLYLIKPGGAPSDQRVLTKAVSLLRELVPSAFTESDPVPFRDQLFRIRVAEITGRASGPTGGRKLLPESAKTAPDTGEADSDAILNQRVGTALAMLSLSPGSQVHVDTFDGVIALTGTAEDAAERAAIEAMVLGVPDVQAVVQELETVFPSQQQSTPAEVAREAVRQLRMSPRVAASGIKVVAEHGWLRLEGVANSQKTRDEVVRRLRGVKGSRGVVDRLRIMEHANRQVVTAD